MIDFIFNASLIILLVIAVTYLWLCVSMSLLFRKINASWWKAFIPLYNISELVRALKLPQKWFYLSIAPYIGSIYAVAIAYRLGQIWNKNFAFSAFWLTIAAPAGFLMLVFSKKEPNLKVLDSPPPSLAMIKAKIANKKAIA